VKRKVAQCPENFLIKTRVGRSAGTTINLENVLPDFEHPDPVSDSRIRRCVRAEALLQFAIYDFGFVAFGVVINNEMFRMVFHHLTDCPPKTVYARKKVLDLNQPSIFFHEIQKATLDHHGVVYKLCDT